MATITTHSEYLAAWNAANDELKAANDEKSAAYAIANYKAADKAQAKLTSALIKRDSIDADWIKQNLPQEIEMDDAYFNSLEKN